MKEFFKKKEPISWTFCFWIFGDFGEINSDETWNPELHDNDSSDSLSTSDNGLVILQEEIYDLNFMNGTHIASFGESDYMIQLWIEGNKFQLRIVTDNRDGKRCTGFSATQGCEKRFFFHGMQNHQSHYGSLDLYRIKAHFSNPKKSSHFSQ